MSEDITSHWNSLYDEGIVPHIRGEVWLVGDMHGDFSGLLHKIARICIAKANIIVLGDCGIGFGNHPTDKENFNFLNKGMQDHKNKLYLIRGNHDNPEFWEPERRQEIHDKYPNITLLGQGPVGINDDLWYVFPGGVSIDRCGKHRREGLTYWKAEEVVFDEVLPKNLPVIKGVLAHVGPTPDNLSKGLLDYCLSEDATLQADLDRERDTVAKVIRKLNPELYVYGHFHRSWQCVHMRPKCRALDILEFVRLDSDE